MTRITIALAFLILTALAGCGGGDPEDGVTCFNGTLYDDATGVPVASSAAGDVMIVKRC